MFIKKLNDKLSGLPDRTLTILLILIGIIAIIIALKGNPTLKAITAAWMLMP